MSAPENKQLIEQYFAAISGHPKPPSLIEQYVDDHELAHHIQLFEAAFPAYTFVAQDALGEDDKVAVRATFCGTHQGEFYGIPATNKQVSISLMLIYRIANGKIVEHWMNADSLGLLQQLGAVPTPA
jgi:predicted ester cyclase